MRETIRIYGRAEGHDLSERSTEVAGFVTSSIMRALAIAVADEHVTEVVIRFDSLGGVLTGIPDLANAIRAAGGRKAVTGFVIRHCCSAAYFLASQCQQIICVPHGLVGSVGVVREPDGHFGAGSYYVAAGRLKAAGRARIQLPANEEAAMQASVDREYGRFVSAVAAGRGVSRAEVLHGYGEGAAVDAGTAMRAGMVDRIASTLDPVEISASMAKRYARLREQSAATWRH